VKRQGLATLWRISHENAPRFADSTGVEPASLSGYPTHPADNESPIALMGEGHPRFAAREGVEERKQGHPRRHAPSVSVPSAPSRPRGPLGRRLECKTQDRSATRAQAAQESTSPATFLHSVLLTNTSRNARELPEQHAGSASRALTPWPCRKRRGRRLSVSQLPGAGCTQKRRESR
jgi:hypothetical protein